jgi:hypothetical protein
MNTRHGLAALLMASWIGVAPAAALNNPATQVPPSAKADPLTLSFYYIPPVGHLGDFPGTLVQLRCSAEPMLVRQDHCSARGTYQALKTADGVYVLVATNGTILRQLDSHVDNKRVWVFGKYYPNEGIIYVSGITAQATG